MIIPIRNLRIGMFALLLGAASSSPAKAQGQAGTTSDAPVFQQAELEQIVAPIALYPDSLIAQILMASTYPLEVVQAERWVKINKDLKPDKLAAAVESQSWDPSVKSLVNFPDVLTMMSEKIDWTTKLGDAFLAQQKEVMDAIQKLRGRAKMQGNLETTEQQTVIVKEEAQQQVIVIESSDPDVVYVPTYNPTVVYGSWPYPSYPPYAYYPPGYVATAAVSFGLGVAAGAAWGAWGSCNWGHGDIDIDNRSFNSTRIDNSRSASNVGNRNTNVQGGGGKWQHDSSHRKGAAYRDQNTANKFKGNTQRQAAQSRDAFRGRAEAGRQDIARGGADQFRGQGPSAGTRDRASGGGAANRPAATDRSAAQNRGGQGNRPQTADRGQAGGANRGSQAGRSSQAANRGGAFDGVNQGSNARSQSQRGQASRSSSPSRSSSASRPSGGGSRGGGGGSRGGGGGGRGGGGRGGRR